LNEANYGRHNFIANQARYFMDAAYRAHIKPIDVNFIIVLNLYIADRSKQQVDQSIFAGQNVVLTLNTTALPFELFVRK